MRADKLTLNENTKLEEVAHYFKNLGPDKQVRARELADGRIQLYVRNDSRKQFFTDKLKPDYLIKRDYLNAKKQILDIADRIDNNFLKARILFSVQKAVEDKGHRHDFYTNEFNRHADRFMNLQNEPRYAQIKLKASAV